ncbi:hypothetical protein LEP1GSC166_3805 [Leptospira kirschneri]|nr:hypothetical protein LEP1GSC166_3805 [Leptospira kirschneri]
METTIDIKTTRKFTNCQIQPNLGTTILLKISKEVSPKILWVLRQTLNEK